MVLSKSIYKDYYNNNYLNNELCDEYSLVRKMYLEEIKWKIKIFLKLIQNKKGIENVLDIGCATGDFLNEFPFGKNKIGIDLCEKNIEFANAKYRRNKYICSDFLNFKFDKEYDIIILSEILEHVENDRELLEIAINNSKMVLINVPLEDECNKEFIYGLNKHRDGHLRGYTRDTINNMINELNADIKAMKVVSIKNTLMFYRQRFEKYLLARNREEISAVTKTLFDTYPQNYLLVIERRES